MIRVAQLLSVALALLAAIGPGAFGQDEPGIERPKPAALDDFETDANKDGVPDGWYNQRDVTLVAEGGVVGPHCLRFEAHKPGRPARLSRAFGVDGRKTEAIVLGLWVKPDQIRTGERLGEDPGLIIDFIGDDLRTLGRGTMGPWAASSGPRWTRVAKRISVPRGTNEAILSLGLLGATGVLEVDGMTTDLVPRGGTETTNLVNNADFELGDPAPEGWVVDHRAHRVSPGFQSSSALELSESGARAMTGLAVPVEPFGALAVTVAVRAQGLRGAGGAWASLYFLDDFGRVLPSPDGLETGIVAFRWAGSFDWRIDRAVVPVPRGAVRAVFQFEKSDGNGWIRLDKLSVTASPNPAAGTWTPYHGEDDRAGWLAVQPSAEIKAKSALDASFLLDAPAGKHGFVTIRNGRLALTRGGRVRFFGVSLLPPTAYLEPARADALADRLARSGINLVRLGDLDTPLGPDRSLFDDSRDDTKAFDAVALAKLDHLIAALKARGIYVALELQSMRRFREQDGVADPSSLPPGGGPAAVFDPVLTRRSIESAKALLEHINPGTGLALRDDPVLAWVTLAGEISLFDQVEDAHALPPSYAAELRSLAQKSTAGTGRRFWQALESAHWKGMADELRKDKLRVPIAGVSHWRRDREFADALAEPGLDLIDDRLYWNPPGGIAPDRRSLLWSHDGGLAAGAALKRRADRPYVVGQWCHQTRGAWAFRYEAADLMLATETARREDWDALVRRGLFIHPQVWGANAAGTGGEEDIFPLPEIVNGIPQVFALWPHAASILLRAPRSESNDDQAPPAHHRPSARWPRIGIPGWDPDRGRLVINTPSTQGLAGWPGDKPIVDFEALAIEVDNPYAVVVASSAGPEPIATSRRLLVTAVARVEPTGFRWVDEWKHEVADPGQPPLLQEPVQARVSWRREGPVQAYALDNTGARASAARLEPVAGGVRLVIDGSTPTLHWELVVGE
ncbi:MAG TPA: hypothetical protein VKP69_02270 [Isosphaeraceae bacterium]|nr:hypothetical protein [Isosphaeraceae bacterium]